MIYKTNYIFLYKKFFYQSRNQLILIKLEANSQRIIHNF